MTAKLKSIIVITRPVNVVITFVSVIVAAFICTQNYTLSFEILLASIAAALTAASGNVINDFFDIEIDKVNRPNRPLPSGKISYIEAIALYFIFLLSSLIFSWIINLQAFLMVAASGILLFLYSKYLKRIPLLGNFSIAFLTGLVFIYGGVIVGNPSAAVVPAVYAFLINLIREIVKDIQDVEGDKTVGVKTFPIHFGFKSSKLLILIFTFILILFTLYPFLTELYKIEYFIIVMVVVNPILVYCIKILYDKYFEKSLNRISNLLKLSMVFGLIAILLG